MANAEKKISCYVVRLSKHEKNELLRQLEYLHEAPECGYFIKDEKTKKWRVYSLVDGRFVKTNEPNKNKRLKMPPEYFWMWFEVDYGLRGVAKAIGKTRDHQSRHDRILGEELYGYHIGNMWNPNHFEELPLMAERSAAV